MNATFVIILSFFLCARYQDGGRLSSRWLVAALGTKAENIDSEIQKINYRNNIYTLVYIGN